MGRLQAKARPVQGGVRHPRLKLLMLVALCLVPALGAVGMGLSGQSWVPLAFYPVASLASLLLYWHDKRRARNDGQRTPEKVLHASELLGGWPGALLAQQLFRHKTRKLSYQLVFWGIVLVHQLLWLGYLLRGTPWLGL
ncbi:DUF1294 domain-containing protein [Pseudomonas entomophila]|uniref:DUF1294 domain-containing protein n=1 Tax=Pseudomonas entomophila TaxID=312306 RepID=UPI0023D7FA2F|nr:DUF1294 domain-containing protein [Pseudomonas entomophila]MDF0732975.1 DUF1294 domain-containing protein [Pseudomonas entomophila]